MDIRTAYQKFLQKVNRNQTNDEIAADFGRFVLIFNEEQNKYIEWILEKRSDDEIRYVQKFLEKDSPLQRFGQLGNSIKFGLPSNYFDLIDLFIECEYQGCRVDDFKAVEVKAENVSTLLSDEFNRPSFKARETFYHVGGDGIFVYNQDFNITEARLTYYRYPRKVDMANHVKTDGTLGTNIDPEWDDKATDRILTSCASRFSINNDRYDSAQANDADLFSKI